MAAPALPGMVAAAVKPKNAVALVAAASADQVARFSRRSALSRLVAVSSFVSGMKAKMPLAPATGLGETWEVPVRSRSFACTTLVPT
jgi:hypothetical protein